MSALPVPEPGPLNEMLQSQGSDDDLDLRVAKALHRGTMIPAVFLDETFTVRWASRTVQELVGITADDLIGRNALELVHPDDLADVAQLVEVERAVPTPYDTNPDPFRQVLNRIRFVDGRGGWTSVDLAATNLISDPGVRGMLLLGLPTSERWHLDRAFQLVAADRPIGDVIAEVEASIQALVPSATVVCTDGDVGTSMWCFPIVEQGVAAVTIEIRGVSIPPTTWARQVIERSIEPIRLALQRDLASASLRREAETDPLTMLGNRRSMLELLGDWQQRGSSGAVRALLYIDVDNFKSINDIHGHLAGDDVLVRYARILEAACDGYGRALRLGGDEFAVTMHTVPSLEWLHTLAGRLVDALTLPIRIGETDLVCSASVGAAVTPHASRLHELLAAADRALLQAKQAGKSRYHLIEL